MWLAKYRRKRKKVTYFFFFLEQLVTCMQDEREGGFLRKSFLAYFMYS